METSQLHTTQPIVFKRGGIVAAGAESKPAEVEENNVSAKSPSAAASPMASLNRVVLFPKKEDSTTTTTTTTTTPTDSNAGLYYAKSPIPVSIVKQVAAAAAAGERGQLLPEVSSLTLRLAQIAATNSTNNRSIEETLGKSQSSIVSGFSSTSSTTTSSSGSSAPASTQYSPNSPSSPQSLSSNHYALLHHHHQQQQLQQQQQQAHSSSSTTPAITLPRTTNSLSRTHLLSQSGSKLHFQYGSSSLANSASSNTSSIVSSSSHSPSSTPSASQRFKENTNNNNNTLSSSSSSSSSSPSSSEPSSFNGTASAAAGILSDGTRVPIIRRHSLHVSVRRRPSSTETHNQQITGQSFSKLAASPAVSFLSQLADRTSSNSHTHSPGVYGPGDEIGPYTLNHEIGSGSFSTVFSATTNNIPLEYIVESPRPPSTSSLYQGNDDVTDKTNTGGDIDSSMNTTTTSAANSPRTPLYASSNSLLPVAAGGGNTSLPRPLPSAVAVKVIAKSPSHHPSPASSYSNSSTVSAVGIRKLSGSHSLTAASSMSDNGAAAATTIYGSVYGDSTPGSTTNSISSSSHIYPANSQFMSNNTDSSRLEKIVSEECIPDEVRHETNVWSQLTHPNIVQLHDVIEGNDAVFVISEIADGGCLYTLLNANKSKGRGGNGDCDHASHNDASLQHHRHHGNTINNSVSAWGGMWGGGAGGHGASNSHSPSSKGLEESEAKRLFTDIANAVKYLHDQGIVHRDIKCENILLVSRAVDATNNGNDDSSSSAATSFNTSRSSEVGLGNQQMDEDLMKRDNVQTSLSSKYCAKLADFGLSSYFSKPSPSSPSGVSSVSSPSSDAFCVGSLHYCSPEEIRQTCVGRPCSDIWSLGCVLYAMLTGTLPFSDDYLPRLQTMIINGRYDRNKLTDAGVSRAAIELVERMLTVKVDDRIKMDDIFRSAWIMNP